MAARSVSVSLTADVSGFTAAMGRAAASVDQVVAKTRESSQSIARSARDNSQEWNTVGTTLTRVGALAAAGLGLSAKAAMDWESAWAGVKKTVDQTSPAFAGLEGELRGMARTMATSHTEIAAVASAAGALGVATPDVAEFTRTMIMLGEATDDLSADQAATSMAQFMNIMGTAPGQVRNLASALVALGNDGASTEGQILAMSQRIAGAGTAIGLTEADVMGFAGAIASVGVEVEAGGTAISTTMLKMEQAVRAGGKELDLLAETAGMSSAEFKQAFETDAAGAINSFIQGLGRLQQSGGDVTAVLRDLGITGIREADTLRRLANAGTLLGDQLKLAGESMAEGTALMDEYGERANTTESKVRVAWNNITDAAISAGQSMLPVIAQAAEWVAGLAESFGAMDPAALGFGAAITAIVAVLALLGGGAIKAVVGLVELAAALKAVGLAAPAAAALGRVGSALMTVGRYAGPAALALGALIIIDKIRNSAEQAVPTLDAMTRSLERLAQAGQTVATSGIDEMFKSQTFDDASIAAGRIDGLADAFTRLQRSHVSDELAMWWDRNVGLGQSSQATQAAESIGVLDQALTTLVETGRSSEAQVAFEKIYESAMQAQVPVSALANDYFPQYAAALRNVARMAEYTIQSDEELVAWMRGEIPAAVQEAAKSNQQLADELAKVSGNAQNATMSMQQYASSLLALSGSEIAVEQAIANVNEALKENGKNIDLTTEAGRQNVSMLNTLGQAGMQRIQTLADQGVAESEQARLMERSRAEYEKSAVAMGYSAERAREMADAMFATVPPNAQAAAAARNFAKDAAEGSKAAADLSAALLNMPKDTQITVTAPGMEPLVGTAESLATRLNELPPDKVITVTMPNGQVVTGTVAEIQAGLERLATEKEIAIRTTADLGGVQAVQTAVDGTDGKIVTISTAADLGGQIQAQVGIDSTTGKTVIVGTKADLSGKQIAQVAVDATTGKVVWINTRADLGGVAAAEAAIARVNNRTVYITTVHRTIGVTSSDRFGGPTRADGGPIPMYSGPVPAEWAGAQRLGFGGTVAGWSPHPRADNIPALLTAREFVQPVATVDLYGLGAMEAFRTRRIDPRAFRAFMTAQGLADGGSVRPVPMPSAAPVGSMGGVVHNTSITVNNPVTRSWAESVRQESALAAVGS